MCLVIAIMRTVIRGIREISKYLFFMINDVWFLCKINLSRFALVGFNFLFPARAMQTKFALLQRG
jgi:hypothetical protein